MWTDSGQVNHLSFAGLRGGGKGGGGGGGQPMQPRSYTDPVDGTTFSDSYWGGGGAEALNTHISQRKAQEKEASDAAAAKKTQDDAAAEQTFQGKRQSAYNAASESARRAFQLQGANPDDYYGSYIQPALMDQYNQIQDLDPNPSAAFPTSLGDTIANSVLSGKRNSYTSQLNKIFTPQYANNVLPDSAIDPYVSQIVSEQFDPLYAGLTNAQKRGTLNDSGYQAALDALGSRKAGATSSVRTLGQGILNTDRANINTDIGSARTDVNNLGFGDTFDPSPYQSRIQSRATSDLSGLGGAIRGAVGDTKYADLTDLLNVGGSVQGATQPSATNLNGVGGTAPVDPLANAKRGLGNVGAF